MLTANDRGMFVISQKKRFSSCSISEFNERVMTRGQIGRIYLAQTAYLKHIFGINSEVNSLLAQNKRRKDYVFGSLETSTATTTDLK